MKLQTLQISHRLPHKHSNRVQLVHAPLPLLLLLSSHAPHACAFSSWVVVTVCCGQAAKRIKLTENILMGYRDGELASQQAKRMAQVRHRRGCCAAAFRVVRHQMFTALPCVPTTTTGSRCQSQQSTPYPRQSPSGYMEQTCVGDPPCTAACHSDSKTSTSRDWVPRTRRQHAAAGSLW